MVDEVREDKEKFERVWMKKVVLSLLVGVAFGLIWGYLLFAGINTPQSSISLEDLKEISYSASECALRNSDEIAWLPNMIVQSNDGNITGVPICVPVDKKTGKRL